MANRLDFVLEGEVWGVYLKKQVIVDTEMKGLGIIKQFEFKEPEFEPIAHKLRWKEMRDIAKFIENKLLNGGKTKC